MNDCPKCGNILCVTTKPDFIGGLHIKRYCSYCGYDSDKQQTYYSNRTDYSEEE